MTVKKALGVAKIDEIRCFRFFGEGGLPIERLDFIPSYNTPGFSYRVAYNGKLTNKYFGSDFKLNQHTALDMLDIVRNLKP